MFTPCTTSVTYRFLASPIDDLLIASSTPGGPGGDNYGYVFSGQSISTGLVAGTTLQSEASASLNAVDTSPPSPPAYRQEDAQLVVAGDANGDGLDDILIHDSRRQKVALVAGGSLGAVRLNSHSLAYADFLGELVRPVSVGDLNEDGIDELALATSSDVRIFYGSESLSHSDILGTGHPGFSAVHSSWNHDTLRNWWRL